MRVTHVVVTGGRGYTNRERVYQVLDALDPELVIQGGATGVDTLAKDWAIDHGKDHKTYAVSKADWAKYGGYAGHRRNREMCFVHKDAVLLAFPGNSGTTNCIEVAKQLKMTVLIVGDL